ncbi:hypothetical protein F2Q70_00044801 [Brassica cretica]|uniref:Uncharacterized protein n=2 Tax=Brassica cretica TaxID=69181 RepID=A0A3N6Q6V4_BRACR|nr:hypothetical protein F2Q70_00044801 [Brassica cretica]KAF2607131.1 hypothetical protein F2Q68_00045772 [Brassica cretica]KAF3518943.1 hypothetical protein DY000_02062848 [Brassica cretica]
MLEMKETNKEVYLIAKSASSTHFGQSYVAAGHPDGFRGCLIVRKWDPLPSLLRNV